MIRASSCFKPSLIYVAVGVTMLTPGWMTRYMIPDALEWSRDVVFVFGYIWAAMMFASAGLNAFMAMKGDPKAWAEFFTIFPIASKGGLFAVQYLATPRYRDAPHAGGGRAGLAETHRSRRACQCVASAPCPPWRRRSFYSR